MNRATTSTRVVHWSTDMVEQSNRCASVIDALGKAIVPLSMEICNPPEFAFDMKSVELDEGCVLIQQGGSAHRTFRKRSELARSDAHTYHFMVNSASEMLISHDGQTRLQPGEGILVDSLLEVDLNLPDNFRVLHVKMSEEWLHRWFNPDEKMLGKRFSTGRGLDKALMNFIAQLSPASSASSPLSTAALAAQFGMLLMTCAAERRIGHNPLNTKEHSDYDKILGCMKSNSSNSALTSAMVGYDLKLTPLEVEQAFLSRGQTFVGILASMRKEAFERMLSSPAFRELSLAELYRRAGYVQVPQ